LSSTFIKLPVSGGGSGGVSSFNGRTGVVLPQSGDYDASDISGVFGITSGGTGISSVPSNGQLLIGNGTGYTQSTLTAGAGIVITNAAGSITIANSAAINLDGGAAASVYGGISPIDGGNAI
jgi:hypothetical protein